ncbi:MAG: hypothetical protein IKQ07_04590 [Bacteroidaceae bacterium]|nr:hypothetical protein [Bacteroidaceae bacterium]MBR6141462.1 hypothetical protein [Bacteroidaceae bacterium]
MAKIIDFNTAKKKIGSTPHGENQQTQEEVRKYILGIDDGDGEEDLHVQMTFLNLDETRTAIVGDFAAVEPLIDELQGDVQRRQRIYDDERKNRGPGIILSVQQVVQLLKMMLEDGWTDLNPDVHIIAEARYKALQERNKTIICEPKK